MMKRRKKLNPSRYYGTKPTPAILQRFLNFVRLQSHPRHVKVRGPCWLWSGYTDAKGYGQFKLSGKARWAHRLSFSWFRRALRAGEEADHICRVSSCVNPWHLKANDHVKHSAESALRRYETGKAGGDDVDDVAPF